MDQKEAQLPVLDVRDLKTWFPIRRGVMAKTVGHVRALDGVSFTLQQGEILGLVGESGCGKTTLGRTLIGLEKAYYGEVLFNGQNLFTLNRRAFSELRRRLQIIFQDPVSSLNPRMNVFDIITEGLVRFRMVEGTKRDHAIRLLQEVGLDEDALFRYPHEFSGGQRQRINIARAISMRPDFIVCDEPVSALDASVQAQIINLLMDLRDTHRLSYLFISHDLSVVNAIADRMAVMYLGKIVEYGPAKEIIDCPMHPYTKALTDAVPIPGRERQNKIILAGETPSPAAPPAGCRFHTRCSKVMAICRTNMPPVTPSGLRQVWCHLYPPE